MINNVSVIIPAYKPDDKLIGTLNGLVAAGFDDIIIILVNYRRFKSVYWIKLTLSCYGG